MSGAGTQSGQVGVRPSPSGDSSRTSTCYAAGGMSLAFAQEDSFVVSGNWLRARSLLEKLSSGQLTIETKSATVLENVPTKSCFDAVVSDKKNICLHSTCIFCSYTS